MSAQYVTTPPLPAPAPSQAQPQVRLELRSNPLLLAGAREMVSAVAKRFGFPDDACAQIALAVDEALCNVIRHGYGRDPSRPIWIAVFAEGNGWDVLASRAACAGVVGGASAAAAACAAGGDGHHPDALRIVIEDEAPQIDPAAIRSRDLDEVRPGGLGVHIIKTVMDEAVYEKRERVGMRLTMLKKRLGGKPVSDADATSSDRSATNRGVDRG